MVGGVSGGAIGVWGGVTGGVSNVLWNKISGRVKTKKVQNTDYTLYHKTM